MNLRLTVSGRLLVALLAGTSLFGTASAFDIKPDSLLSVDQNRSTVVDRVHGAWGDALEKSNAGISREQLREMLMGLRADHLLAASLSGSLEGLRDVLAKSVLPEGPVRRDAVEVISSTRRWHRAASWTRATLAERLWGTLLAISSDSPRTSTPRAGRPAPARYRAALPRWR
jgi:hypothetical protein